MHGVLAEEEGASIREKLLAERRAWFTEEIGKGVFPDSMQAYYDFLKGPDPEADAEAKEEKGKKDKKGAKDKKAKDKKDKKGKGKVCSSECLWIDGDRAVIVAA